LAVVGREAAHRDVPVVLAGGIHVVGIQRRSRELALGGGDGYDTDS